MTGNSITRNGVTVMATQLPQKKGLAVMVGTDGEFKPYAYVREENIPEFRQLWKKFVGDEK